MASLNFPNRTLFHGDNLEFLRGMNSETVDLIATDPPFNKSRDFHATPDSLAKGARFTDRWSWDKDVHPDWVEAIKDDWPGVWAVIEAARAAHGEDMAAFLCWLGVRLMACHRILKPTGSLYLHIDHTAHAWTKALLDGIFGRKQFRNEIVWYYKNASRGKKQWAKSHDTLLWYSASVGLFNRDDVLMPYESGMTEWRYKKAGKVPPAGKTPDDVIVMPSLNTMDSERTGYPTQKPLALYERIIRASSNEGDMVLDPFAGCATTPVAAERLGRQWVGMDIWEGAHDLVVKRLQDEKRLFAAESVTCVTSAPERTDAGQEAAPAFTLKVQIPEPPGLRMNHAEMKAVLIGNDGLTCKGCLRRFDDPRYLDLDHNTPRSDGGLNHISNRMLLCGPCNRAKSNKLTLSGLRALNKRNGWMAHD